MNTTIEQTTSRRSLLGHDGIILTALIGFVILISALFFIQESLRLDEAQSLWQTSRSPLGILRVIAEDVHVPLYHLLLHYWQLFFGSSVIAGRILSLVFFAGSIPMVYLLTRQFFTRSLALFTTLLVALSPFLNWYGNEIRMYSLLAFISILNQYFFLKLFKSSGPVWLGYGLTALLGMFTHYFFGLILISQALFFFLYPDRFPRHALRHFVSIAILVSITFIPWIFYVQTLGGAGNTKPSIPPPTSINVFNTFSNFLFGFQTDTVNTIFLSLWPLVVLLGFMAIAKYKRVPAEIIYFILSVVIPISIAFVISLLWRPIYLSRYLILILPSLYIFIVWIFSTYPPPIARVAKFALVIVMFLSLGIQALSAGNPVREDYRQVVDYLNASTTPRDLIVVSSPFTVYPIEYYYQGYSRIDTLPRWNRFQVGPIPPFVEEELPHEVDILKDSHDRIFMVMSYDQGYKNKIKYYFDMNFKLLDKQHFSPGLDLYVYELY